MNNVLPDIYYLVFGVKLQYSKEKRKKNS